MPKKLNLIRINSCILSFLIIYGCVNKPESEERSGSFCDQINRGDDLYSYWMDADSHDSLLMVVESCEQTPEVISARLNLLSLLRRNEEALKLISTLKSSDFLTPYDSISSLNYFKVELTDDSLIKEKLHTQTLEYISRHLEIKPTDTLALFNYSEIALKVLSEKELYNRLDSMSKQNGFNPVYEFVIESYLPDFLERYKKLVKDIQETTVI